MSTNTDIERKFECILAILLAKVDKEQQDWINISVLIAHINRIRGD